MQPLPMNELVKAQLEEAGFEVNLQTIDWNTLLDVYRGGVDRNLNYDGLNFRAVCSIRSARSSSWSARPIGRRQVRIGGITKIPNPRR
jgi:ABC-type transport system substrate-binding protein